jgi:Domain of unknown function (DUF5916)/Carbohydrate family 9 binding domain-like
MKLPLFTIAAMLVLSGAANAADSLSTAPSGNGTTLAASRNTHPPVVAVRLSEPVSVDGRLTEPVWQNGNAATDFKQRDPHEGGTPSQKTEVRLAYDDDALYVGARCYDTAPESLLVRLTRRDVSIPADRFAIYLDPYYDRRSGYYFLVNCAGSMFDGTLSNDGAEDNSWDGVWDAKAKVDDQGWTVEMRIPYSQLRFSKADSYRWGVNFRRRIERHTEEDFLVYQPKKESGFVSRFPDLVGIQQVSPGRSIEVIPYFTQKAEYLATNPTDPFNDGSRYTPDGGVDLRMGVGSKLTLNATVNPDFGQVEVDPAIVNLSDVETFFQEKRPFFVEGSSVFRFGNEGANSYWGFNWPEPTFFYSRRVGRSVQGSVPDAEFADVPVGTSILGAGKLIGKISPSMNFGTLHAVTAEESADLSGSSFGSEAVVEPLAYYGVLRTQKEFKNRQQGLGIMGTAAARSFDDDAARLESELNSQAYMAGVDGWMFLDKDQEWVISGWSAMSHVRGSTDRMTALQQNSQHYLQRPDAPDNQWYGVDPDATSLTGFGTRLWLNKQKGNVFSNAAIGYMDPKFDVNEMGFMSRADVINSHFGGGYKWTDTGKVKKYQDIIGAVFGSADFEGNVIWAGVWGGGFTEFANNHSFEYKFAYNPGTTNNRRTRGGPLTLNKPGFETYTYYDTDGKAKFFWFIEGYTYSQPENQSYDWNVFPGIEWKPVSNISLRVAPGFERVIQDVQYVDQFDDPGATGTYGRRYVFAELDQRTLSAQIRLNWAFTPKISLQTFVQPLISAGNYYEFKSLARPKSYDFAEYDYLGTPYPGSSVLPSNPDFNFKSLRGNAVFRWEYMPGSALFLVWTQERVHVDDSGEFRMNSNSTRLMDADADNVFLAKVTYYFNL